MFLHARFLSIPEDLGKRTFKCAKMGLLRSTKHSGEDLYLHLLLLSNLSDNTNSVSFTNKEPAAKLVAKQLFPCWRKPVATTAFMPTLTAGTHSGLLFWPTRPRLPGQALAHTYSYEKARMYRESFITMNKWTRILNMTTCCTYRHFNDIR